MVGAEKEKERDEFFLLLSFVDLYLDPRKKKKGEKNISKLTA